MQVTLIGAGPGGPGGLTAAGLEALRRADVVFGAPRLLDGLGLLCGGVQTPCYMPQPVLAELAAHPAWKRPCVLLSGDVGFYSGAARLRTALERAGYAVRSVAGVPSVACFAAALNRPWQAWRLVSAHGLACDAAAELRAHPAVFFLTGGAGGVQKLLAGLCAGGFPDARVTVGEALSYPEQKFTSGRADQLSSGEYLPLSVLLAESPQEAPHG